jgi:hypothetical protein
MAFAALMSVHAMALLHATATTYVADCTRLTQSLMDRKGGSSSNARPDVQHDNDRDTGKGAIFISSYGTQLTDPQELACHTTIWS